MNICIHFVIKILTNLLYYKWICIGYTRILMVGVKCLMNYLWYKSCSCCSFKCAIIPKYFYITNVVICPSIICYHGTMVCIPVSDCQWCIRLFMLFFMFITSHVLQIYDSVVAKYNKQLNTTFLSLLHKIKG